MGVAWVGRAGGLRFRGAVRGVLNSGEGGEGGDAKWVLFFVFVRAEAGLHERLFSLF